MGIGWAWVLLGFLWCARCADPGDGAQVDLHRDSSIAPLNDQRRRLRAVLGVVSAIDRS